MRQRRDRLTIVINALSVRSGGGLTSLMHLVPALQSVDPESRYVVFITDSNIPVLERLPQEVQHRVFRIDNRLVLFRLVVEQFVLPFILWRMKADWLYSLGNQTVLLAPCRVFLIIENANPFSRLRGAWSFGQRIRFCVLRILGRVSALRAMKIRFLSENSREIICRLQHIPLSKTCVIPHGVEAPKDVDVVDPAGTSFPGSYILTVANVIGHKNLHTLLQAFELLGREHGYAGHLLIAGAFVDKRYRRTLDMLQATLSSSSRVHFLGWVDPEMLPALYKRADCFVFASAEETFGIPAIEAMASRVPVAVPSLRKATEELFIPFDEICGDAVAYFDPFDPVDIAKQVHHVLSDEEFRLELIRRGSLQAKLYTWDATARGLREVFHASR